MKDFTTVFKRYEQKYILDRDQAARLSGLAEDKMHPDAFGKSTICSVYFDTDDYRIIRASLEKPVYKEKLRLRCYGIPKSEDKVFLELKKKYKGVVYKRRIGMPLRNAADWMDGKPGEGRECQIGREIEYFMRFYQPLPKAFIAYEREAFYDNIDPNLRLTVDSGIRMRTNRLSPTLGCEGTPIIRNDERLIEIKTAGAIPLWLCGFFEQNGIVPTSFSKYGTCYTDYIFPELRNLKGGIICA
ncbi:MAG TPA: polyphosphate polymerase domain-containing protein [Oscillospiraceae bacterium]|nr:polyphosphate polymerase domain-containing protein [Oscillospiraceae bacterium]HPS33687.1 polyphosphate polymerase domain-containing protein [Oscillospiraceae bacterium]